MVDFFAVTGKAYWRADALLSLSLTQQDGALVTAVMDQYVQSNWESHAKIECNGNTDTD